MKSQQVRSKFLNFFKEKQHRIVSSSPIITKDDPTLMFINSGMAPFKDYFTSVSKPPSNRMANSQKCLRVSGKHNDLDDVGYDSYHHTFFEMLGNWSFGDYFKKEIIGWSYDLMTNIYGLSSEDLYVSVFEGSKEDKLDYDKDTFNEWKKYFSEDKIINGNKKDNFWEMGDIGPCGPCSEIHVDLRSPSEKKKIKGSELVNKDHPQVVEIWNLVFIQFNRKKDGSLQKLDKQYVDTGMGLERLCMALQNKNSTYETDLFSDIIKEIENVSNKNYLAGDEKIDIGMRVISDHLRAIVFTILDGQIPSNTGPGYVIRRILRRAIRYGYTNLDIQRPFIYELVDIMEDKYSSLYPNIITQKDFIKSIIKDEEEGFLKTLNQGLNLINELIESEPNSKLIKGDDAFKLYDTFGFPIDLTSLIAAEKSFKVDIEGFNENMKIQKNRSKSKKNDELSEWVIINNNLNSSVFMGYDHLEVEGYICKYREAKSQNGKTNYHIVTDVTTFYPEGGGQIGDTGEIISSGVEIPVIDTFKDTGDIIHSTTELPLDLKSKVKLKVNNNRRSLIESNHTSTHLLHQALRKILGSHVEQRGSMISEDMFRFDFSHPSKLSDDDIDSINGFVNDRIKDSIPLIENREEDYDTAIKNGAIGLFTEKYEDKVRTVKFDESYELCGGTHVENTNKLKTFSIISEGSQAFGIRRITATCNEKIIMAEKQKKNDSIEKAANEKANKELKKEIEIQNKAKVQEAKKEILEKIKNLGDISFFADEVDLDPRSIKELCFMMADQIENLFLVLLSNNNGKVFISCFISKNLVDTKGFNAAEIIKELSPLINGSGGGQAFYASGGGSNLKGISSVISKSEEIVNQI